MKYLIILFILVLSACSSTADVESSEVGSNVTDTNELVEKAIRRHPTKVGGTFQLKIKTAESKDGTVYLYTHLNDKDPKNIAVVLVPATIESFIESYGSAPESYFIGRTVEVIGNIELKEMIPFKDGKNYYKTQIKVISADKLTVLKQV